MNEEDKAAYRRLILRPPVIVKHSPLPIPSRCVESKQAEEIIVRIVSDLRPLAVVLHKPSPDLYLQDLSTSGRRLLSGPPGIGISAEQLDQLIPEKERVDFGFPPLRLADHISLIFRNYGPKAVIVNGYIDCLVDRGES